MQNFINSFISNLILLNKASTFKECTSLEKITIPPTVEKILNGAFEKCTNLRMVNIQNSRNRIQIEENAFKNCPNLQINYIDEPQNN